MIHRSFRMMLLPTLVSSAACQCAKDDTSELDTSASSSASDESSTSTSEFGSSSESTGTPFDASRWIGRYHYENAFVPFGERGSALGTTSALINFEIRADFRAEIFYDECGFEQPVTRSYEWSPGKDGWLDLHPGPGEPWLRFLGEDRVGTLRVRLVEPCRELWFEIDGWLNGWLGFYPGASCWVDRCTVPSIMHVDYCEGEEPPPCP